MSHHESSHEFSQLWTERHRESEAKWKKIRERLKKWKRFGSLYVWYEGFVINPCGYCEEFDDCLHCPLHPVFCYECREAGKNPVFWRLINETQKEEPDLRKALGLATEMLIRIREDRPS